MVKSVKERKQQPSGILTDGIQLKNIILEDKFSAVRWNQAQSANKNLFVGSGIWLPSDNTFFSRSLQYRTLGKK